MTDSQMTEAVKAQSGLLVVFGIALSVLGILAILSPLVAGLSVAILVGAFLLAGGLAQCVFAFRASSFGAGVLAFVLGVLTVACGLLMIAHPLLGLKFMTLLLAAYLIVEGIFETIFAFQLRPTKGWGWTLFSGIVSVVLGVLIWSQWPLSGVWAIGVLLGVKLLFLGTSMIGLGAAAREAAGKVAPKTMRGPAPTP